MGQDIRFVSHKHQWRSSLLVDLVVFGPEGFSSSFLSLVSYLKSLFSSVNRKQNDKMRENKGPNLPGCFWTLFTVLGSCRPRGFGFSLSYTPPLADPAWSSFSAALGLPSVIFLTTLCFRVHFPDFIYRSPVWGHFQTVCPSPFSPPGSSTSCQQRLLLLVCLASLHSTPLTSPLPRYFPSFFGCNPTGAWKGCQHLPFLFAQLLRTLLPIT